MKNGVETRPNGVVITKKVHNGYTMYHVSGSSNGPWDYLNCARKDADGGYNKQAGGSKS